MIRLVSYTRNRIRRATIEGSALHHCSLLMVETNTK